MAIQVVPYTHEWVDAVLAFNSRMHAGGTIWGWYGVPSDSWLPQREGKKTWREHYLAVEDGKSVRGAYALRPQEWLVNGGPRIVTDWQGPVTEALIEPRYSPLGLRLLREMLRQYPLLYSWGHGGLEQPLLKMLERLGWLLHPTPFCLRILHPTRFLRRNGLLRSSALRRLGLDLAAYTGIGALGIRLLHAASRARAPRPTRTEAHEFDAFESWADVLWDRCGSLYAALATRDAATMNTLLAPGRWPPAVKLRVTNGGATLGWVVLLCTQMAGDPRFGDLHLGSIVDCLAAPADARAVIGAALETLRGRQVDLVVSNQSHPAWIAALAAHGFLAVLGRRMFAASPELHAALQPFESTREGLHLTNMDGHGPMGL